ncbi:MAG: hypothetical protein IT453_19435 [Planctomycetes bacterium]|nr:hypothetical protein [Planctomycetota bacterium]
MRASFGTLKLALGLALACLACAPARVEPRVWVDATSGIAAALALDHEAGNEIFAPELGPTLDVAVWDDGTVVWSREGGSGERTLLRGRVEPERVAAAVRAIAARIETVPSGERSYRVPDSGFDRIAVRGERGWLELASAHEGFEQNPKLVALDHGITAVDERGRAAMLEEASEGFRALRAAWADARRELEALVPPTGEPCESPPRASGG